MREQLFRTYPATGPARIRLISLPIGGSAGDLYRSWPPLPPAGTELLGGRAGPRVNHPHRWTQEYSTTFHPDRHGEQRGVRGVAPEVPPRPATLLSGADGTVLCIAADR